MSEMQFNKGTVQELYYGIGVSQLAKANLLAEELGISPEELFQIDDPEDEDSSIWFQSPYDDTYEFANGRLFDISGAPSEYFEDEEREYAKYLGNGKYEVDYIYYNGGTDFSELFGEYLEKQERGEAGIEPYFVKFREYNDNEGESWNFWLQLDGNEEELKKFKDILDQYDEEEWFSLNLAEAIPESEVDILVKHTESRYMSYQNKVVGKFTLPKFEAQDGDEAWEWINDNFYKGDIKRHFSA